VETVRELIREAGGGGVNLEAKEVEFQRTPLHIAAACGQIEAIRELAKQRILTTHALHCTWRAGKRQLES